MKALGGGFRGECRGLATLPAVSSTRNTCKQAILAVTNTVRDVGEGRGDTAKTVGGWLGL